MTNQAPSTGIEPVTYRLGGGCSILLSYEGNVLRILGNLVTPFVSVNIRFLIKRLESEYITDLLSMIL